jgi:hypothetical protein
MNRVSQVCAYLQMLLGDGEKKDLPKSGDLAAHFYPYQECQSFPEELRSPTLLAPARIWG